MPRSSMPAVATEASDSDSARESESTSAGLGSSNDSPLIRIGSVRTDFGCQNAIVSPSAS